MKDDQGRGSQRVSPLFTTSAFFETGMKPMSGTYPCFIFPGMKPCYPEVAFMLRCGSCSSKDKKLSLKNLNLRTRRSTKRDLFPSNGSLRRKSYVPLLPSFHPGVGVRC